MEIKDKIKEYLNNPALFKRALIIDGGWGTGKSYFINHFMRDPLNVLDKVKYFKIMDMSQIFINENFLIQLNYFSESINSNNSPNNNFIKKILKKKAINFNNKEKLLIGNVRDYHISTKIAYDIISYINICFCNIKKYNEHVLIIDELERCKDESVIQWLFLKLSKLQENKGIRVIIIMNYNEMSTSIQKIFDEWEEKLSSIKIKINKSEYVLNKIKDFNINKNEDVNIRLLENYEIISNIIDKEINLLSSKNKKETNEMIKLEVKHLKQDILSLFLKEERDKKNNSKKELYKKIDSVLENDMLNIDNKQKNINEIVKDYFLLQKPINYMVEENNQGLNIDKEDMKNMNYDSLYKILKDISNRFTDENCGLLFEIDEFYKKIVLENMFYKNKKNNYKTVIKTFKKIFNNKNICNVVQIKSAYYRKNYFDKYSLLSYIDFFYNSLNIKNKEKKYLNNLIIMFIENEKKIFNNSELSDRFTLWNEYKSKEFVYNHEGKEYNGNKYKSILTNMKCFSDKEITRLIRKINKNTSYFYKNLLKVEVTQKDFHTISEIARFHAKYNNDVISLIFNKACINQEPLNLKGYLRDYYASSYSLSKPNSINLISQNKFDNLYRLHNINPNKRVYIKDGNKITMDKYQKKYALRKLTRIIFIDLYE